MFYSFHEKPPKIADVLPHKIDAYAALGYY